MPISISGSGTISGLIVDGLPAGTVNTATIAANAVVTSTIAANAVVTIDIAAAAVTPAKLSQPLTVMTSVASTSGTSITFTNIPSWARRITVMLQGVSTTGTSVGVQLGTSGGFVTSGYLGVCNDGGTPSYYSSMFLATPGYSAGVFVTHGMFVLTNITGNSWTEQHILGLSSALATPGTGAGSIALAATLTQIRLTTVNGTDTFDLGNVNVMYE